MRIRPFPTGRTIVAALVALCLAGCDGGGTDVRGPAAANGRTLTAVLLDGIVEGARYRSGRLEGITDARGVLRYVEGEPVEISIGGIVLGEARPVPRGAGLDHLAAERILTPLELAGAGSDLDHIGALNRVRLLMALDDDGDPANGIRIDAAVDAALADASTPAFDDAGRFDPGEALAASANATGRSVTLVAPAEARAHLCESLARTDCAAVGPALGAATPVPTVPVPVTPVASPTPPTSPVPVPAPVPASQVQANAPVPSVAAVPTVPAIPIATDADAGTIDPSEPDVTPIASTLDAPDPSIGPAAGSVPASAPASPVSVPATAPKPIVEPSGSVDDSVAPAAPAAPVGSIDTDVDPATPPSDVPPSLTGSPPASVAVGAAWRFDPVVGDGEGDELVFALRGAPAWMRLDPASGVLSGTPAAADVGVASNVVLSASDGTGPGASVTFDVTVFQPNRAPRLGGVPATTIDAGATFSFTPVATDADGDELIFTASNLPAWAVVDPLDGTISGTPDIDDVGAYAGVTLLASDGEASATLGPFELAVVRPNRAPALAGSPTAHVLVGERWSFEPESSDADGDALAWSATNLPDWLTLDAATGALSGTPDAPGAASGIVLSASDGEASTSLAPFDVEAVVEVDLARTASAVQGSTYRQRAEFAAARAIDGDAGSINHTACTGDDWLQVDLGGRAVVSRVVVVNRDGINRARLDGAALHVGDADRASGPLDASVARAATLDGSARQTIAFDVPRDARHVTLELDAGCLHVAEIEVHGRMLDEPHVSDFTVAPLIERDAAIGRLLVELEASDAQGDELAFAIVGDVPFAVDADGRVTVAGPLEPGRRYEFDVTVDDGRHAVARTIVVEATEPDAVDAALASGDASGVTERELIEALADARARIAADHVRTLDALYGRNDPARAVGPLDWEPTQYSHTLVPLALAGAQPVLVSNHAHNKSDSSRETLALAGTGPDGARTLLFGGSPIHALNRGGNWGGTANPAMHTFMENAVHWLAGGADATGEGFDVVLAHLPDLGYQRIDASTHGWFAERFPDASVNAEDACDGVALPGCLADADLLVIGNAAAADDDDDAGPTDTAAIVAAVVDARARGVPVMFLRNGYYATALDDALMPILAIAYGRNFFNEGLLGFVPGDLDAAQGLATLVDTVDALDAGRLDFDYAAEDVCTDYVGKITCHESRAVNGDGVAMDALLGDGTSALSSRLRTLDRAGTNLFELGGEYDATKLAVLLADKYRETVRFPMDRLTTDSREFQRARFADAAVHYARPNNPMQPDVGLFTDAQRALHDGAGVTRELERVPTRHSEWTSTGLYVPPGRPVTVTRTDASPASARVRANMLRGTTRLWNADGYDRPTGLTSTDIALVPGASVTLSSPHGGPLYLWTGALSEGAPGDGVPVGLRVSGALDNPLLDAFDEASVAAFSDALLTTDSDWVDIRTPFAEIHSLRSHVRVAFARQDGDLSDGYTAADVIAWADDLNGRLIGGNYEYAGFSGAALAPLGAGVAGWCTANLLTSVDYGGETVDLCRDARIHARPRVQHANAGLNAACGALCSGNPFDSGSPIMPLGWGENHEMGHNLQRTRLKIHGGRSNEVSNNLFPLQTARAWAIDEGLSRHPDQTRPDHRGAFDILQAAIAAGTEADIDHPMWSGTGTYDLAFQRLSFFIQLVYASGEWDLWTKAYIADRILTDAAANETTWLAVRDRLGFGGYTAEAARALSGNDFIYVTVSGIDRTDYAGWFAAWGVDVSSEARAQVAANGITAVEPVVFRFVEGTLPVARPTGTIALDGMSAWADPEG